MIQSALALRDYQEEAIQSLIDYRRGGGTRALVALPTGTGKTILFAQMPKYARKKVLVIAHREELLDQAAEKIQWASPGLAVDIEQAERHASQHAKVIVASIQTLTVGRGRLAALDPAAFSSIVVDEAHHVLASSYLRFLHHFGLAPDTDKIPRLIEDHHNETSQTVFSNFKPAPDAPYLVGFTATPSRTDGRGLEYVFDDIVFSRTIREMMDAGWLCKIRGVKVKTAVDISKVKTQAGDFQEKSLADTVNTPERNRSLVNAYKEHAPGRRALVFCVNVAHANDISAAFAAQGIAAPVVVGSTPSQDRKDTIAAYRSGAVPVMVGVMVFTEGFDAPETDCVIMARPTKSSLVYTQAVGRGTRIAPGKADLLVIDMVDISRKAHIQTINTLFGLPPLMDFGPGTVDKAADKYGAYKDEIPEEIFQQIEDGAALEDMARNFDPLARTSIDPVLAEITQLAWVRTASGYALNLFNGGQIGIIEDVLGHTTVRLKHAGEKTRHLSVHHDARAALVWAEIWAQNDPETVADYKQLARDAKWRDDGASEKQLALLAKLKDDRGDPVRFMPGLLTKGQASALIGRYGRSRPRPAYMGRKK